MKKPFTVLFEDNHLLVVDKASGVLVQGDSTGDVPLAELCKEYIKRKYNKPGAVFLGVVHRLDRPVSGVVVLARTSKALERMNELFRDRQTKKTYWANRGALFIGCQKMNRKIKQRHMLKKSPVRCDLS
jgi:23S rRNA pseudouridine1911/1915/1917 synthase